MQLSLHGKHAVVCGASRGIGRAIAHAFAGAGARLLLAARDADALEKLAAELPDHPAGHQWVSVDFDDPAALKSMLAERVVGRSFHILVNNTGGPAPGPLAEAPVEALESGFRRHVAAAQLWLQAVLPAMQQAGWGRVINIISTSVKQPITGLGVSNTIRGAMASWAKTLAEELGPFGITVNNILPGYTSTERLQALIRRKAETSGKTEAEIIEAWKATIPLRRFARPEEIAAAALFLASPAADYINGVSLPVDGGRTRCL